MSARPPPLALADALLASTVSLPHNPSICYAKLTLSPSESVRKPHEGVEFVRQHVLTLNSSSTLLDSLLTSVHTGLPGPSIYVFAISSCDKPSAAAAKFQELHFDFMTVNENGSFSPKDLYACSSACSLLEAPCPDCHSQNFHTFFPRKCFRFIYSHFLEAVRTRLLDDIVKASYRREPSTSPRKQVQRLKGGFLFGQYPLIPRQNDWEHYSSTRPLVFCHLQALLAEPLDHSPRLIIHPILMATPYIPLIQALPLPSGTPIILLPHGTPAYYRTTYAGPTGALIKQFKEALQGLGASNWEEVFNGNPGCGQHHSQGGSTRDPMFIIAQITVENRQGADKGVLVIYPTALCLSFIPSIANQCQPLDHMLDLPTPLQPSPEVQQPDLYIRSSFLSANSWSMSGTRKQVYVSPTNSTTNDPLQTFRSLSVSKHKDIHRVADEVSVYVESVARERERERERLKREREGTGSSPRLTRTAAPTPAAASTTPSNDTDQVSSTETGPPVHQSMSVPQTAPIPPNSFYPSPPLANSGGLMISDIPTSPTGDRILPIVDPQQDVPSTETIQTASASHNPRILKSSFDPFGNIDSAWSQSYMDMDLDFDMSMGFGMSENNNDRVTYMDTRRSTDFEDIFTDDDFSFFDQPSQNMASNRVIAPPGRQIPISQVPTNNEPLRTDTQKAINSIPFREEFLSGLSHTASIYPSLANQQTVGLLPAFIDIETRVPDLSPPSGQSPETESGPTTPDVQLSLDMTVGNTHTSFLKSIFDPIPFASYHRVADGKYLHGKFALSSPRREECSPKVHALTSKSPGEGRGWKSRYNAITDPRIGVVQKLIGVKRKLESEHASRETKFLPSWVQEDDWAIEQQSEEECFRSDEESEEGEVEDSDSNNGISRPATPPPPYLPLGPSLLCTQFEHSLLLSIGMPLRSTDVARNTSAPLSVPTPVSPAAILGASTEKTKSLEAIASAVAAEVVENSLWAETWKSFSLSTGSWTDVWPADIKYASTLLNLVSSSNILDLASLFNIQGTSKVANVVLKPLEPPMISIGKGNAIIYVLPTALRFWDKLGLGPRGGKKNSIVFVLYDNGGDNQRELQVDSFLSSIMTLYSARNYGSLALGRHSCCVKDGHLPVKYDKSLRKTIASFISHLTPTEQHYILCLVIPVSIMTLASPILRQAIAALKKARVNVHTVYELVPEHRIFGPLQTPHAHELSINSLCSSIYDRTPSVVNRCASRDLLDSGNIQSYIEEPAFTLSRPLPGKASFVREAQATLDVMDRFTFMHVGYQISLCGKWLVAACIDQRGEAHDIGVWLAHTAGEGHEEVEMNDEAFTVMKVLEFALSFAKKANVEWRITITKYGIMEETELNAWIHHLKNEMSRISSPQLHVFILCTEAEAPWSVFNARHISGKPQMGATTTKNTVFTDVSSHTYMLRTRIKVPLSLPTRTSFCQFFVPEAPSDASSIAADTAAESRTTEDKQQIPHPLTLLPYSSMTLIYVPSSAPSIPISMLHIHLLHTTSSRHSKASLPDNLHEEIVYNFFELSHLAKLRWKLHANPILPFHLGAVQAMRDALERDKDRLEVAMDG